MQVSLDTLKIQLLRHTHTHTSHSFTYSHNTFTPPPSSTPTTHTHNQHVCILLILNINVQINYSHRLRVQQLKQHTITYPHSHTLYRALIKKVTDVVLWFYILLMILTFQFQSYVSVSYTHLRAHETA